MSYSRVQASGLEPYNIARTVGIAVVLFICSAGFLEAAKRGFFGGFRVEYFALILASLGVGYRDRGILRVWVFMFALAAGFGIHLGGIGITGEMPGVGFRVLWAILVGIVTAVSLGTVAGYVGVGARRLVSSTKRNQ